MLKRLELDTLQAELSSIEYLIQGREDVDPIGFLQMNSRRQEIAEKIDAIKDYHSNKAEVGLFFGGNPVFGSKGIDADFTSAILDKFQSLVSKRFAFLENGSLSQRGPIPNSINTKLMITDVARGSFGFILEEGIKSEESIVDSDLKYVVEDVNNIIGRVSSSDEVAFEDIIEQLDSRVMNELISFYSVLFNAGATLKIVDDRNEYILSESKIRMAKSRMETVRISEERNFEIEGELYLLPSDKKFEIMTTNAEQSIKGRISKSFLDKHPAEINSIVGKHWHVRLIARDVLENDVVIKTTYTLIDCVQ
ncbi:hypothetical protein QLJ53_002154 [Escherichia coli]|nr:hypothetical protein [Escherichia coli]